MSYDVIIIGAGHNGLVCASILAKYARKVLVLERRPIVGGACVTEEIFPGFQYSPCAYTPGMFQQSVVSQLKLKQYGFELLEYDPVAYAPHPDGKQFIFWNDLQKTVQSIAKHSSRDAIQYVQYEKDMSNFAMILRLIWTNEISTGGDWRTVLQDTADKYGIKRRDIDELSRILPMSIADVLDEYFEDPHLKGVLASEGIFSSFHGPHSSNSVYIMLYLRIGRGDKIQQQWPLVRGGMGAISNALARAAQANGAEVRTDAEVERIIIENDQAAGVVLKNGHAVSGKIIVSNADAKRTFLQLVEPDRLQVDFLNHVSNIRARGVSAKVNFALRDYPRWLGLSNDIRPVVTVTAPDMDYLERAFADAEKGRYSREPFLDIAIPSVIDPTLAPEGKHVMSVYCLFAPYHLSKGNWDSIREPFGDTVTQTIERYAPGFSDLVLHRHVVTPLDLERTYALTEGHVHHEELSLDQVFGNRPFADYKSPIRNLYLCGASTHPGGGVTGIPGTLAARKILASLSSRQ
jgi:phytoene dehydrogenase-like protein